MKKLLTAFAMALLLVGCAKEYDDTELKNRVTTLETKMDNLVAQMQVVQKVALGEFVQKVEETTDGLTITYGDGTVLTVHVSTGSGAGTLSVLKNAAGDLCWAIDGTILQYDGKDLVVGAVSNIYVENGKLYAVINGEAKELGGFSGGSELKDGIFTNLAVTDEAVVLTLSDGSTIKLPLANAFKLVIAKTKYAVTTTDPFNVPYTVQAKTNNTVVDIFTDGNYSATVEADKFVITPKAAVEGSALAYADSQVGLTSIVKLTFGAEGEEDYATIADEPYSEDIDYIGEAENGTIEAHVVSNASIDVKSEADWISIVSVKATTYTVTLKLEDNTTDEIRTGEVKVYAAGTENVLQTIKVAQKAGEPKEMVEETFKALNFNNHNNSVWVRWGTSTQVDLSKGYTIVLHFLCTGFNDNTYLGKFAGLDNRPYPQAANTNNIIRFGERFDNDGKHIKNELEWSINQNERLYASDLKENVWYSLALSTDAEGKRVLYIDGKEKAAGKHPDISAQTFGAIEFGDSWGGEGAVSTNRPWPGSIRMVSVWDRALSNEEIAALVKKAPADLQDANLVAYWPMDEGEGHILKDYSPADEFGQQKLGDINFATNWLENVSPMGMNNTETAASIDGSWEDNSWMTEASDEPTPDDPVIPVTGKFKVINFNDHDNSVWVRWGSSTQVDFSKGYSFVLHFLCTGFNDNTYLGKFAGLDNRPYPQAANTNNILRFGERFDNDGNHIKNELEWSINQNEKIYASDLQENVWYSLAITTDAEGNRIMYIDGEQKATGKHPDITAQTFGAIEFGDSWGGEGAVSTNRPWPGYVCMISAWNKALSAQEVAALVKTAPEDLEDENLVAYWPMTEGSGYVCKDYSPKDTFGDQKLGDIDFSTNWLENVSPMGMRNTSTADKIAASWVKTKWVAEEEPAGE